MSNDPAKIRAEIDLLNVRCLSAEKELRSLSRQKSAMGILLAGLQKQRIDAHAKLAEIDPSVPEPEFVPEVVVTMKPRSEWPVKS